MFKKAVSIFIYILFIYKLFPCTLWSAIGESTAESSTLIAKNRDWAPDHKQVLKIIKPKAGYIYFALIAEDGDEPGVKAGINEKGLVAVTASASCIPKKERDALKDRKSLLKRMLTEYSSVDALLNDQKIFSDSRPMFYMTADKNKIAYIEVAIDGKYSISVKENGTLYHTNQYIDKNLNYSNKKVGKSSLTRFGRISELLSKDKSKFSFDDFLKISTDKNDGPDNSIWRSGSKEDKERTLASWIVELSKNKPPKLFIKLANPNEKIKEYNFIIDEKFWKK